MPTPDYWVDRLVTLAQDVRPATAPRWDAGGIRAHIRKVLHHELRDVALAVIRAASDPTLRTPAPISDLTSSAWRERGLDQPPAYTPGWDPKDTCTHCSRVRAVCQSTRSDHEFESVHARAARLAHEPAERPPLPRPTHDQETPDASSS